jgi:hypothetical protein
MDKALTKQIVACWEIWKHLGNDKAVLLIHDRTKATIEYIEEVIQPLKNYFQK